MEETPAAKTEEKPKTEPESPAQEDAATTAEKNTVPIYVGVGLLIAALIVVLLVVNTRPKGAAASDDKSVAAVNAELEAMRSEVNRQRMSMGLRPLEGGSESVDAVSTRLKKDADTLVAMANSFQEMVRDKDIVLDAKNTELINSEKLSQSIAAENSRLQAEISRLLVSGADGELARKEVDLLKEQKDRLAAELAKTLDKLKNMDGGKSGEEFADLQRRYDEAKRAAEFHEGRVAELQAELARLRIFASSEAELMPAAVELFRTLRNLEGLKDSDNMKAYSDIGVNLGAKVLRTLDFPTGSSQMTPDDESAIPVLTEDAPDGDLILVVGYASTTGNVEANRVLSSDRATAVAQAISKVKRPEQFVQAVYIGQTNRFSSAAPERNQIVEVWQIRKK